MFQQPLPAEYTELSDEDTAERIGKAKASLDRDLVILGHHYQRDEIIRWADFRGDSLKLSQLAAKNGTARYIVFCGVHFMAETADILTSVEQIVVLPNLAAGCSMADMASIHQLNHCWDTITHLVPPKKIVPITYVNSSAEVKAFVGRNGGACCTSSNARKVLEWALAHGEKALFLPDQHLGRNTAVQLGFDPDRDMLLWDPNQPMGGIATNDLISKNILLWKGHCSVHGRFNVRQIEAARKLHPGIQIIVHPECTLDVVKAADMAGSTEFIVKQISQAPAGSSWAVGTEINLVNRLAKEHPDQYIACLDPIICPCSTMYRIHPHFLCWALENLAQGKLVNPIQVPPKIADDARLSLERMLSIV